MSFSEQLKTLMTKADMSATDLAKATGLSEASISDYRNGKKEPRSRQSISLAKALNVSLDTLWETDFQTKETSEQSDDSIDNDDDIPVVIAASSGHTVDAIKREEEYIQFKQKIVRAVYAANLDMRQMEELYKIIQVLDSTS